MDHIEPLLHPKFLNDINVYQKTKETSAMSGHRSQNLVKYALTPKKCCARTAGGFSATTFIQVLRRDLKVLYRDLVQAHLWPLEETEAKEGALF